MTPEQYAKIQQVFVAARSLEAVDRPEFLENECRGDEEFRQHVESLLEYDRQWTAKCEQLAVSASSRRAFDRPDRIGPYTILDTLGEGGMGVVYLAEQHEPVHRRIALKILRRGTESKEGIARFQVERQALALMNHSGLARVYDFSTAEDGRPYFVMELVAGEAITSYCDARRLPLRPRLELFVKVCQAVEHAHRHGVLHRDIKPSNVLVMEEDGRAVPKVIDFGVAKLLEGGGADRSLVTEVGRLLGTPEYMSPEQADLNPTEFDHRSDTYALGILLHELITGLLPFDPEAAWRGGLQEVLRVIREVDCATPSARVETCTEIERIAAVRGVDPATLVASLRGDLDHILLRALEKAPEARYQSPAAIAADIELHFRHEPISARPPSISYRLRKYARRNRRLLATFACVVLSLVIGLITTLIWYLDARKANEIVLRQVDEIRTRVIERDSALAARLQEFERSEAMRLSAQAAALAPTNPALALDLVLAGTERMPSLYARNTLLSLLRDLVPSRLLEGHSDAVMWIDFDAEGRRVVTASNDGTARVWDTESGEMLLILKHPGAVRTAKYDPSGRRIVTAGGNHLLAWDARTGKELVSFRGHRDEILSVEFSTAGDRIVTASYDQTACIFDAASGKRLHVLAGHQHRVFHATFSPDGERVVTSSRDKTARVWNASTGEVIRILNAHRGQVECAVFSPDGSRFVTVSTDRTARIWDASTLESTAILVGHENQLLRASFDARGERIVTTSWDGTARLWSSDGTLISVLRGHTAAVREAEFSPDGSQVATTALDGRVVLWDPASGASLRVLRGHQDFVAAARFSSDGMRLATCSADRTARVWEVGAPSFPLRIGFTSGIVAEAFSPVGTRFFVAALDGRIQIRDLPCSSLRRELDLEQTLVDATWSLDGMRFVAIGAGGRVRVWDAECGELVQEFEVSGAEGVQTITSSVWAGSRGDSKGVVALLGSDRILRIACLESGALLRTVDSWATESELRSVRIGPGAEQLLTVFAGAGASVWSFAAGGASALEPRVERLLGHDSEVVAFAFFTRDGRQCLTGARDNAVILWDVTARTPIRTFVGSEEYLVWAELSRDGRHVAACGQDRTARVWDVETGDEHVVLRGHTRLVRRCAFDDSASRLVTASEDETVRVWNLTTGQELLTIAGQSRSPRGAISPDGQHVLAVWDRFVEIVPLDLPAAVNNLRKRRLSSGCLKPDVVDYYEIGSAEERTRYRGEWVMERTRLDLDVVEAMVRNGDENPRLRAWHAERLAELTQLAARHREERWLDRARTTATAWAAARRETAGKLLYSVAAAERQLGRLGQAIATLEFAARVSPEPQELTAILDNWRLDLSSTAPKSGADPR